MYDDSLHFTNTVLKADRLALPSAAFVTLKTVEVSKKERIPISTYRLLYRLYIRSSIRYISVIFGRLLYWDNNAPALSLGLVDT